MAVEIERKFLIVNRTWEDGVLQSHHIVDHLIAMFEGGKARIRYCDGGPTLTLKGQRAGLARSEFHIPVTKDTADPMVAEFARAPALEKWRHEVPVGDLTWQVDEYRGALQGLITADVELPDESHPLDLPAWAGPEITHDRRYSSSTLARAVVGESPLPEELLSAAE